MTSHLTADASEEDASVDYSELGKPCLALDLPCASPTWTEGHRPCSREDFRLIANAPAASHVHSPLRLLCRQTPPVMMFSSLFTADLATAGEHDAVELLTHYVRDALLLKASGKGAYTYHQCVSPLLSAFCRLSRAHLASDA